MKHVSHVDFDAPELTHLCQVGLVAGEEVTRRYEIVSHLSVQKDPRFKGDVMLNERRCVRRLKHRIGGA
jgi:hypothetical protein